MADWNYSHLSVHSFDIFTKAVAQPGGRDATIISQDQPESAQNDFQEITELVKNLSLKSEAGSSWSQQRARPSHS